MTQSSCVFVVVEINGTADSPCEYSDAKPMVSGSRPFTVSG